jgi:hypothetical protein
MCSDLDAGLQHRKAVSAVDNPPHAMEFEEMHGVLNILAVEVKVGIHMCLILPKHRVWVLDMPGEYSNISKPPLPMLKWMLCSCGMPNLVISLGSHMQTSK